VQARLVEFGVLEIEGQRYEHDVVIEGGQLRKRKKGPSKPYRGEYGHTPLSADEDIPWGAPLLVIGSGAAGQLPVMPEVPAEAERRGVELIIEPTEAACRRLADLGSDAFAAILHVTC
jgi:hypothetical protein